MTPSPSAAADGDSRAASLLSVAAALASGLAAGWTLTDAGFAAVEAVLVAGVVAAAAHACVGYLRTRAAE